MLDVVNSRWVHASFKQVSACRVRQYAQASLHVGFNADLLLASIKAKQLMQIDTQSCDQ